MMPFMVLGFLFAIFARTIIFITVKCEWKFAVEFEHRVEKYLIDDKRNGNPEFHDITKKILDKTHYEFYVLKAKRRMRRFDYPVTFFERVFGIVKASERVIEDTLKQTQYIKSQNEPDFDRVAKYVFGTNPFYNRFMGFVPQNMVDDLLNVFPGLLIICGILGTFVGIVGGIPELGQMDVTDVQSTNTMLNGFLTNMSFAMSTSILGMLLSLIVTIFNTALSSYGTYIEVIDIYKNALNFLWKETHHATPIVERRGSDRKEFGKKNNKKMDSQVDKKSS